MDEDEILPELVHQAEFQSQLSGRPRHVLIHENRRDLLFATSDGTLHVFRTYVDENTGKKDFFLPAYPGISLLGFDQDNGREWRDTAIAMRDDSTRPEGRLELTALQWLLGDATLLVGDSYGGIQAWSPVREFDDDNNPRYRRIRALPSGSGPIAGFCSAEASKSFLAWDTTGRIRGIYNTSEREFFDARIDGAHAAWCIYCPKGDGALAIDTKGRPHLWWMDLKHAEVSFKALFGRVFYEGYQSPRYEWQSHAGTDDVENKFSLIPLITGSIKGGLYALLFALPLAVLGAVYTSEFMAPRLRSVVKPTMEVMASLPSVVLGFLGALYFAPEAATRMPTLLVFALLTPVLFMLFGWLFGQLPPYVTKRFTPLVTTIALAAVLGLGWGVATVLGPRLETRIFPAIEGANPALVDSKTFKPLTEADAKAYSAGNFRAWTDGGRELPREAKNAQGVTLPKGWWIPGGHALFATLMIAPFALLAGLMLKLGHALLFGGTILGRAIAGRAAPKSPLAALRDRLAGTRAGLRPVIVDVTLALCFAGLAFALGWMLSGLISPLLEMLFFSYDHPTAGRVADFRRWLTGPEGWKFNQTNSLIVGFAMGFAVIPIIYSIAEDALSSVPNQLRAASLACGASRWQTAIRVVVPAAASGIFSAMVIGLGRALGETMIVVMAAGGTPLNELQPLSGFRSLSAAIAIEMPEAPHGSTHYRTLFLGGLILFLMTFVISTMAEFVRMRLRRKLSRM
ncbi:MAG: ABC transporter permease subunit [Planctomycetes bacterium]|nr:ABC transporter permease subunit [Planctomycetota bacterium]